VSPASTSLPERFDPRAVSSFRFTSRSLDEAGNVVLGYALDDALEFEERFTLPLPGGATLDSPAVEGLLALLHFTAGVSYFKAAIPETVAFEGEPPGPATARLLEALYSEGLGEFAAVNRLPHLPRPSFGTSLHAALGAGPAGPAPDLTATSDVEPASDPSRVLVPVGGGKDSAVALELVRASGLPLALFSVGGAAAIAGTVEAAGLPWLQATRQLDPRLLELNRRGALNGHVPITAIVASAALLTAALNGCDAVALANERSASAGNTTWDGVEVNHQFSKSLRAERLLAAATAEVAGAPSVFSVLRAASELSIARAFARLPEYHHVFTSCNRIFRLDPATRTTSWCCDCDKCRFVFLILAPFMAPAELESIFGAPMLDDTRQFEGFALLTGTGGHKPFECVGEIRDSVAALRLLADDERWSQQRVLRRLLDEVLPQFADSDGRPQDVFALSDEHRVPPVLASQVDALLGA
jgi:hypothetical protein